ncbi:MAG TPA: GTPase [Thermoplasmata archaeon]|nr:GTPase [Thermoplasmata archaeon]
MLELRTVLGADGLIDKAFRRASKATSKGVDRATRTRNLTVARVQIAGQTIEASLRATVKGFPSLDRLPPFYREIADILLDVGRLKKHLGAADWAADQSGRVTRDYVRRIGKAATKDLSPLRREAFGRLASIVKQVGEDLDALEAARRALRRLPTIDPEVRTIVVAGYPNVGKSAFVRAVSTGTPRVAEYPFTTQGVTVGHFERGVTRYQILDTPGLLDRPMEDRNRIERQAIAALAHVADAILFLLDPTGTCGYPLDAQERLLDSVRAAFPDVPTVVAENKADLPGGTAGHPRVSALRGEGLEEILDAAVAAIRPEPGRVPVRLTVETDPAT